MTPTEFFPIKYVHCNSSNHQIQAGKIIAEMPVSLTINGELWITFMCTPTDLDALAVGFAYNEKMIEGISEVESVQVCDTKENIDLWLSHSVDRPRNWMRTSGCTGGLTSVNNTGIKSTPMTNGYVVSAKDICHLVDSLYKDQKLYRVTGGVHTSCLSDGNEIILSCEDIGRHNTLDKIAGKYLIERIELPHKFILSTGRISSEMLQKAARIGASFVISRTSPSSLSIELAEKLGITLIGYAHRNQFNIYSHPERVIFTQFEKPGVILRRINAF
jgi:FdhD protein